ncbi:hypothetical protein D3C86_1454830 [compost metagenome]
MQHADVLLRLHRSADAATVLDAVPAAKRDPFWQLRRAETHLELGELAPARACIDAGLAIPQTEYRATFLSIKSDIQHRAGEPQHFDTLTEAIACCESPLYTAELTDKLALRIAGASAS